MERPQVVVFDDTEQLAIDYLTSALAARDRARPVGTKVPNPRPGEFVRVMATGGSRRNLLIDQPLLTLEAWSLKESDAVSLVQLLRGLVNAAAHETDGFQVPRPEEGSSPVNLPDPDSGHTRYTFTTAVDVSGRPL